MQAKAHTEYDLFRQILFVVFLHIRINDRTYGIGHATPVNSACIGSRRPTGRTSSGIKQPTPCMSIASGLCHRKNDFISPGLAICKTAVINTSRQRCVKAGTTCIIICKPQSYSLFLRHNPESVRRRVKYCFSSYILRIPCPGRLVPRIQRNRQPAIRHKLHIMRKSFTGIRNGSLLGSMPMTASVQPPQNIGNSSIR